MPALPAQPKSFISPLQGEMFVECVIQGWRAALTPGYFMSRLQREDRRDAKKSFVKWA